MDHRTFAARTALSDGDRACRWILIATVLLSTAATHPVWADCGANPGVISSAGSQIFTTAFQNHPSFEYNADGATNYCGAYNGCTPVGPLLEGSFWALGSGNPAIGMGDDNGAFDLVSSGGISYAGYASDGFYAGAILNTGWQPGTDGCIGGNNCLGLLLTDQDGENAYFAFVTAQSSATFTTNLDQGGTDGSGFFSAPIIMVPIPTPVVDTSSGIGISAPGSVSGVYNKDGCSGVVGYHIYSQVQPTGSPPPTDLGSGWNRETETPVGLSSGTTIPSFCTGANEYYLAMKIAFDSGFETHYVSTPSGPHSCTFLCGDGILDTGEICDDGNNVGGDGCSADCLSDESCGNGDLDPGEACDDGNNVGGDGCSADCLSDESCGNGNLDPGEACDDGNNVGGDGCSADCLSDESCGNGTLDPGEACDDGNMTAGDGCSAMCMTEAAPTHTVNFILTNTGSGVSDGRLRFAFDRLPSPGEEYFIDNVTLSCDGGPTNLLVNGDFGTLAQAPWKFFSNAVPKATAAFGTGEAVITFGPDGSNQQLYQKDLVLPASGTECTLTFDACSTGGPGDPGFGHNFGLKLHKHTTPFTNYGLRLSGSPPNPEVDLLSCSAEPVGPFCGDGVLDSTNGVNPAEDCDNGGGTVANQSTTESATCDSDCTFAQCGDGTLNSTAGEQCDDGNVVPGDTCDTSCQFEDGVCAAAVCLLFEQLGATPVPGFCQTKTTGR